MLEKETLKKAQFQFSAVPQFYRIKRGTLNNKQFRVLCCSTILHVRKRNIKRGTVPGFMLFR
jgi:hypothetical protein